MLECIPCVRDWDQLIEDIIRQNETEKQRKAFLKRGISDRSFRDKLARRAQRFEETGRRAEAKYIALFWALFMCANLRNPRPLQEFRHIDPRLADVNMLKLSSADTATVNAIADVFYDMASGKTYSGLEVISALMNFHQGSSHAAEHRAEPVSFSNLARSLANRPTPERGASSTAAAGPRFTPSTSTSQGSGRSPESRQQSGRRRAQQGQSERSGSSIAAAGDSPTSGTSAGQSRGQSPESRQQSARRRAQQGQPERSGSSIAAARDSPTAGTSAGQSRGQSPESRQQSTRRR